GELVVQDEPVARDHLARPAGLLDGQRVGNDVAPLVGHGQVGRGDVLGVGVGLTGAAGGVASPVVRGDVAGRDGLRLRSVGIDVAGAFGGEAVAEQVADRDVDVRRVPQVAA